MKEENGSQGEDIGIEAERETTAVSLTPFTKINEWGLTCNYAVM